MATDKDKLIVMAAEVLQEFMSLTKLDWGSVYLRFVRYSDSQCSTQWSYVHERKLIMVSAKKLGEELVDKYMDTLEALMKELFIEIERENEKLPVVAVLKVTANGEYNVKFDYSDTNALEINLIRLCLENSYFTLQDVDVPDEVKEFQKEMAAAEGRS